MIELKNVSFCYGENPENGCLKNINLKVNDGEILLIVGESGCGKTTVTRLINGLIPHYYDGIVDGDILIDNISVKDIPMYELSKKVGSVFQNPRAQFFNVDTNSELAFSCENQGMEVSEIERRMDETIEKFNIQGLMNRSIFDLSGGQKQKIACASVSIAEPEIMILDEPSSNLDMSATHDLKNCIKDWKKEGKTVVIAEHRLSYLIDIVDRILYMKNGEIVREYSGNDIKQMSVSDLEALGLRNVSSEQFLRLTRKIELDNKKFITLNNFQFAYKNRERILNINKAQVPCNEVVAVIGYNGAGKSTFAKCFCGFIKKFNGSIDIDNKTYNNKKRLEKCFMVMQDVNHQLFTESVMDEVLISMEEPDEKKAESIMKALDIWELRDKHPMSLSGGQKQRVAIGSAVASDREILLFDEPTSGLDLRHMKEVAENIENLHEMGKSIFVISHDLELILRSCTYVMHIEGGTILEQYSLDELGRKRLVSFFEV